MEEAIEVPASLIKLERMRARARCHLGGSRELQSRVNELADEIRSLKQRNFHLSERRTIAALEAMHAVAKAALDEHHERADEFRLYERTRNHLLAELLAWGIE